MSDVLASAIVLAAALVTGITGFGFVLLALPFLALLYPPKTAVSLSILLDGVSVLLLLYRTYGQARRSIVAVMAAGSLIGIPLGAYFLVVTREDVLLALIGGVILVFAVAMLLGFSRQLAHENIVGAFAGFLSGMLGASTGLNGPPIVLFGANQGWEKVPFRANMTVYKVLVSIPTIGALLLTGLVSTDLMWLSVKLVPAVLIGLMVGARVFHSVSPGVFQRFVLLLLIAVSLLTLWAGFR